MQKVKMDEILKKRYNWAYYARGTPVFFFFFFGGGGLALIQFIGPWEIRVRF